jgi:hypothetical protein
MKNNNDSIELQSNFKSAHVGVDLANLPIDHCLRKKIHFLKKKKKNLIIILMIATKSKEYIYKKKKKKKAFQPIGVTQ